MNDRFVDIPVRISGVPHTGVDYDRYQIDLNVRY
jgi:hypothetical protein